ncbi:MAG: O-sialoglycoprotein endopeptidase Gcp [Parcubacteria group bacterium Gr01-1014_70]|nr:MAG: O-sialoglycoprotein endopeptidase Gcp [Parcubacteria group bacterium Gr01-1014_70]
MPQRLIKHVRILAIETSCDETAIAIIQASPNGCTFRVLSNMVLSQIELHTKWGGVVPNLAKREHQKNLSMTLLKALRDAGFSISKSQIPISNQIPNSLPAVATQQALQACKFQILNSILEKNEELKKQFEKHIIKLPPPNIDLIAVTQGPGLEPALWVGVNFARALSFWWDIPLVGINHMEGHVLSALIEPKGISNFQFSIFKQISKSKTQNSNHLEFRISNLEFPAVALLVSGGHTELVLIKKPLQYKIIGETRDDAAGEAFDKVARILGLGYPGGPAISRESEKWNFQFPQPRLVPSRARRAISNFQTNYKSRTSNSKQDISLPRPMIHSKDFDFSFSGLKTAVLYMVRDLEKQGKNIKKLRPAIAKEFQDAVVDVLVSKTIRAAKQYKIKTILLGGGVAANKELRKRLAEEIKNTMPLTTYYLPLTTVTGDNALMIAVAALIRSKRAKKNAWKTLKPNATLKLS